jgi:hypothetical protein
MDVVRFIKVSASWGNVARFARKIAGAELHIMSDVCTYCLYLVLDWRVILFVSNREDVFEQDCHWISDFSHILGRVLGWR